MFSRISQNIREKAAVFKFWACQIRGGRSRRMAMREKIGKRMAERGVRCWSPAVSAMLLTGGMFRSLEMELTVRAKRAASGRSVEQLE